MSANDGALGDANKENVESSFIDPVSMKGIERFDVTVSSDKPKPLSVLSSMATIEERFGYGVLMYFDFHIFILILNFVLSILFIVAYVVYFRIDGDFFSAELTGFATSSLFSSQKYSWIAFTCSAFAIALLSSYFYHLHLESHARKRAEKTNTKEENINEIAEKLEIEVKHRIKQEKYKLDTKKRDIDPDYDPSTLQPNESVLDTQQKEKRKSQSAREQKLVDKEVSRQRHLSASPSALMKFGEEAGSCWELDLMDGARPEDMGFIESHLRVSSIGRKMRQFISYTIFLIITAIFCGIDIAANVYFSREMKYSSYIPKYVSIGGLYSTTINVYDFILAGILFILSYIGQSVCGSLTHFECHRLRIVHSKHKTAKLFILKIALILTVYISQRVLADLSACPMQIYAVKFFALILTDFSFGNLLILAKILFRKMKYSCGLSVPKIIQFDVANEYMMMLYRQLLIYLGMSVFPPMPILGFIANIGEYFFQRYRLCKLSYETKRSVGFMKVSLPVFCALTVVVSLFAFPNGPLWILTGEFGGDEYKCKCGPFIDDSCPASAFISNNSSSSF
eukprot:TRINITY_DN2911_c0_g1_i1.p1 TRINITY_DN2911_c0_g1~~TRINITY_DN2911_c0_g1_i1.p1  ORF type:complete len:567 (+),score=149.50 TRINITY_DN2911_c0_g1_i1:54-1754(+)